MVKTHRCGSLPLSTLRCNPCSIHGGANSFAVCVCLELVLFSLGPSGLSLSTYTSLNADRYSEAVLWYTIEHIRRSTGGGTCNATAFSTRNRTWCSRWCDHGDCSNPVHNPPFSQTLRFAHTLVDVFRRQLANQKASGVPLPRVSLPSRRPSFLRRDNDFASINQYWGFGLGV